MYSNGLQARNINKANTMNPDQTDHINSSILFDIKAAKVQFKEDSLEYV